MFYQHDTMNCLSLLVCRDQKLPRLNVFELKRIDGCQINVNPYYDMQ